MVRLLLEYNGKRKFHSLTQNNLVELISSSVQKFNLEIGDTPTDSSTRRAVELSEDPSKLDQQSYLIYFYNPRLNRILTEQDLTSLIENDHLEVIPWKKPSLPAPPQTPSSDFCALIREIPISRDLIQSPWKSSLPIPVYDITDLDSPNTSTLLDSWRSHGYLVLKLDSKVKQTLTELNNEAEQFFSLPDKEKKQYTFGTLNYLGYATRPDLHKEFYQVRQTQDEMKKYLWPASSSSSFQTCSFAAFHQIKEIASKLFHIVIKQVAKDPSDLYWNTIIEKELECNEKYSQAVLEIFNYHATLDVIPCKYHSDIGMITVIPKAAFGTGLQLYDWKLGTWLDMEVEAPDNYVFCFAGETLARITNNFMVPAMHQVFSLPEPRRSFPFLLLAKYDALLDSSYLDSSKVGTIQHKEPVRAGEFVAALSAQRISQLFKYKNVPTVVL